MAHEEKLPWELTEEILSRIPPKSLFRFRTVSKQWNALFNDKIFIHNHKKTFQFILTTKSKIYSVSIIPKIEVLELTLDISGLESEALVKIKNLVDCNEFLLCGLNKGAVVWNLWLRQTRLINQPSLQFNGIGYIYGNNRLEKTSYKILASNHRKEKELSRWKIHDLASDSWKDKEYLALGGRSNVTNVVGQGDIIFLTDGSVSLNGVLYMVAYYVKTSLYLLVYFDFFTEIFVNLCDLPFDQYHVRDAFALRVFSGDRFSLLKQCHITKKIEVWVSKNKIDMLCGKEMEWMIFMEVSIPDLPALVQIKYDSQPSYFIHDKKLVVCSCDEIGRAWIYVVGNNTLISKTQIDSVVDPWPLHCTYLPSLVPVPQWQREEAELQV